MTWTSAGIRSQSSDASSYQSSDQRTPLSLYTLFTVFLPPVLLYYLIVLILVSESRGGRDGLKKSERNGEVAQDLENCRRSTRLRLARLVLIPPSLLLAYRNAKTLDMSFGYARLVYQNQALALAMFTLSTRVLVWGCIRRPVIRIRSTSTMLDAADLAFSFRGVGWTDNSKYSRIFNTYIPSFSSTSPTVLSFLIQFLVFDTLHYTAQSLVFPSDSFPLSRTIYPPPQPSTDTLTRLYTLLLPLLTTFFSGLTICTAMLTVHTLSTLIGVIVLRQNPEAWPPAFDKPWLSESLADFWGKRWHQYFRVDFVGFGGGVVDLLFRFLGLTGSGGSDRGAWVKNAKRTFHVLAAFLVSGVLHFAGLWGMYHGRDRGSDSESVISFINVAGTIGFFLIMGLGIILENSWTALTGRKVRGWVGWLWTMSWVIGWGQLLVEAWARSGMIDSLFIEEKWRVVSWVFGERMYSI